MSRTAPPAAAVAAWGGAVPSPKPPPTQRPASAPAPPAVAGRKLVEAAAVKTAGGADASQTNDATRPSLLPGNLRIQEHTELDKDGKLISIKHSFRSGNGLISSRCERQKSPDRGHKSPFKRGRGVQRVPSARPWRDRPKSAVAPDRQRQSAAMKRHLERQQQAAKKLADETQAQRKMNRSRRREPGKWRASYGGDGFDRLRPGTRLRSSGRRGGPQLKTAPPPKKAVVVKHRDEAGLLTGGEFTVGGTMMAIKLAKKLAGKKQRDLQTHWLSRAVYDAQNYHLKRLTLIGQKVDCAGAVRLADAIALSSLMEIHLTFNNIANRGAIALASAAQHCKSLHTLGLGNNRINDDGVVGMCHQLRPRWDGRLLNPEARRRKLLEQRRRNGGRRKPHLQAGDVAAAALAATKLLGSQTVPLGTTFQAAPVKSMPEPEPEPEPEPSALELVLSQAASERSTASSITAKVSGGRAKGGVSDRIAAGHACFGAPKKTSKSSRGNSLLAASKAPEVAAPKKESAEEVEEEEESESESEDEELEEPDEPPPSLTFLDLSGNFIGNHGAGDYNP